MPMSPPVAREPIHTRTVTCRGWRRADGLWDVEGHLTDVKTYPFDNAFRGRLEPGDPIHEMRIRLTLDDGMEIVAIEAATEKAPFAVCPDVTPAFQALLGLRVAAGFTAAVKERLGGPKGCTHLVELLGPMATTAFQTIFPILSRERPGTADGEAAPGRRPALLDSCHVLAADGEVARQRWPAFYTGPRRTTES